MKNKPLAIQIWLVFAAAIIGIFMMLSILIPITLREFFTNEVYYTIESAQEKYIYRIANSNPTKNKKLRKEERDEEENRDMRSVINLAYPDDSLESRIKLKRSFEHKELVEFLNTVKVQIENQNKTTERYEKEIGNSKIFYVVTQYRDKGEKTIVLSYMWDTYRNSLLKALLIKIMIIIIIAVIASLFLINFFTRYLTQPLKQLEKDVYKIAKKDWYEPVNVNRKDEIGMLSNSIEQMRRELVNRDESQQWMLQNISHELKTPVMVIRSYAQSVEDGIFPKGDLLSTMKVIDSEAERLQNRIKDLLYLTKLEYMLKHQKLDEILNIKELIKNVIEKLKYKNNKINWCVDLENIKISGKEEEFSIAIENLIDNAIRYSKGEIKIDLHSHGELCVLRIYNSGEPIEQNILSNLFNKFQKGKKGKFGLGLVIVKNIVKFHNGEVWVANEENGVAFYIRLSIFKINK